MSSSSHSSSRKHSTTELSPAAQRVQEEFFLLVSRYQLKHSIRDYALADSIGISRGHYSQLINNQRPLSMNIAVRIADVIGYTIDINIIPKNETGS